MSARITAVIAAAFLCIGSAATQAQSSRGDGSAPGINLISAEEAASLVGGQPQGAGPGVIRIDQSAFQPGAGLITFSELPLGTTNPVYTPAIYGGLAGDPQVSFGGFFAGQALGTPATCPPGAALTGCVVGTPTGPMALAPGSPAAFIVNDGANPTSPVLSGSPTFNGPIAILFNVDVAGVGLDGGFFDDVGGTAITAFDRNGNVLGSVLNEGLGIEFLGLVTANGSNLIAGLLFSLVGNEAAGFAIDNVRFGTAGNVNPGGPAPPPAIPAPVDHPLALLMMLLGVLLVGGLAIARR